MRSNLMLFEVYKPTTKQNPMQKHCYYVKLCVGKWLLSEKLHVVKLANTCILVVKNGNKVQKIIH